jgi:immunoglobulin-binding protein 1
LDGPLAQARRGGPLLSTSGKPLQPFTLTDKRTQLRDGVFRPGHNLPTMSIDEYLEEERRRGGIIEGGGNNAPAPEIDEDNMALADAETMKAREWDEFKESNPKGSGNTLNRG